MVETSTSIITYWFSQGWRFFTEITSPYFGLNFASYAIGVFVVLIAIRVLSKVFGSDSDGKSLTNGKKDTSKNSTHNRGNKSKG